VAPLGSRAPRRKQAQVMAPSPRLITEGAARVGAAGAAISNPRAAPHRAVTGFSERRAAPRRAAPRCIDY